MKAAAADARQVHDKVAAARVWLMKHKPFFGVLARALRVEATSEVAGMRLLPDDSLRVHPELVAQLRLSALCARLAHVSLHAALGAFVRRRGREPRRWNLAHDLAIAPLLTAAELHTGGLLGHPRQLDDGAPAEAYYEVLEAGAMPAESWCDLSDPPPKRAPEEATDGDADGTEGEGNPQQRRQDLPPEGGLPLPRQQPSLAATELSEQPSAEDKARALQWQMRLLSALEEEARSGGKTFGDMPEWIEELVRATIEPPAHWSVTLQRALSSLRRRGRSYLRPSRRMSALAGVDGHWPDTVTMPGRRIEQAGRLAVVIDTSASISVAMLARFLGVVASIATAEGIDDVRLLCADAAVSSDITLFAAELYFQQIALSGRGGTDFRAALLKLNQEALRNGERYTVVYLTDLDGRFPAAAAVPGLALLWVVPPGCSRTPPFGELLRLNAHVEAPNG